MLQVKKCLHDVKSGVPSYCKEASDLLPTSLILMTKANACVDRKGASLDIVIAKTQLLKPTCCVTGRTVGGDP